jgi:hypothetical protein
VSRTSFSHLAVAQVEVVEGVGDEDVPQDVDIRVVVPLVERQRPIRAHNVLVHPALALPELGELLGLQHKAGLAGT